MPRELRSGGSDELGTYDEVPELRRSHPSARPEVSPKRAGWVASSGDDSVRHVPLVLVALQGISSSVENIVSSYEVHTIPVPIGYTVEMAWEEIVAMDQLVEYRWWKPRYWFCRWANVAVWEDGHWEVL